MCFFLSFNTLRTVVHMSTMFIQQKAVIQKFTHILFSYLFKNHYKIVEYSNGYNIHFFYQKIILEDTIFKNYLSTQKNRNIQVAF